MVFDVPDLAWWIWALIALAGAFLAQFIGKSRNQFTTIIALLIGLLSGACGMLAIFEWIKN